ncbi:YceI family protein [Brevundimonas sp. 2R-24]|uniref:YceI family protein n=1 Tax=Peiella sedimenti TaxID=3061083 RepID=A0ABT8SLM1_9CAUL|nr:YceI family protein [Caulobacteraceae bacterium XZ-24]
MIGRRAFLVGAAAWSVAPDVKAQAAAPRWIVDPGRSRIGFQAQAAGESISGHVGAWTADLRLDPAQRSRGGVTLVLQTGSIRTGVSEADELLGQPDLLHTARHPTARFVSRTLAPRGADGVDVVGDLTLKGVTRRLRVPASISVQQDRATATGRLTIDRTLFGVGQGAWGDPQLFGRNLLINFQLSARRSA